MIQRRKTRQVKIGNVKVGGDAAITVQSMTTTDTTDVKSTLEQIHGWYRDCLCPKKHMDANGNRVGKPNYRHLCPEWYLDHNSIGELDEGQQILQVFFQ